MRTLTLSTVLLASLGCGDPSAVAAVTLGTSGGVLRSSKGVLLEVPQGTVDSPTAFTIRDAASPPALPAGTEAVTDAVLLESGGRALARPVRVTLPVPLNTAGRLVLLQWSDALADWVPLAGAEGQKAVAGYTTQLSTLRVVRLLAGEAQGAACFAPKSGACDLRCGPAGAFPLTSCTGTCDVAGAGTTAGVRCEVPAGGISVQCTCTNPPAGVTAAHAGALNVEGFSPLTDPVTALYAASVWCGWPCGS